MEEGVYLEALSAVVCSVCHGTSVSLVTAKTQRIETQHSTNTVSHQTHLRGEKTRKYHTLNYN